MLITAIVEGHGEQRAVPVLLRRFLHEREIYQDVRIKTIRAHKGSLIADTDSVKQYGIQYYVGVAREFNPAAILVLLDADETCIVRERLHLPPLGPWLEEASRRACNDTLIRVVVANREYEAWLLNAWHLMFPAGNYPPIPDAEQRSGCKMAVGNLLPGDEKYEPTLHQLKLTQLLPFDPALGMTSRSYRRLLKVLDEIAQQVLAA